MIRLLPDDRRRRWLAIAGYALAGLVVAALLVLAVFPLGVFKPAIERRLSARFGRPVTIAALERTDVFSLTPTVSIRGLRVPQPAWAGRGDLALVDRAEVSFSILPALTGRVRPSAIAISGARVALQRAPDRRENWHGTTGRNSGEDSGERGIALDRLTIRDLRLSYRDAVQDRNVLLRITADPAHGLRGAGRGTVRGSPIRLGLRGAPIAGDSGRWPFRATIDGADLAMTASGTMARPLDTGSMILDVTARGRDLKMIDAIIEAGLFETRPVTLAAHVERGAKRWTVTALRGTIGGSRIAGRLTVDKRDRRTLLDGALTADLLDFDDFASPAGTLAAKAKEQAIGLRVIPDTRINLARMGKTDGRITFRAMRVVSARRPSAITRLAGEVTLERQLLRFAPLTIGLKQGTIAGTVTVDQRGGVPVPTVRYDLRLVESSIGALAGGGGSVTGRVDGRAILAGRGSTIRESIGRSDGRIALVARDGTLPERIAAALGFDAGRAILAGSDERAGLRCVVAAFDVRGGQGRATTFVVDTTQSQLRGQGSLTFPDERLAITLTGTPKRDAILRLPGSAVMSGTIREPDIVVPPEVKSAGNILKAIGRAITGRQGPAAADADCNGLAVKVLR